MPPRLPLLLLGTLAARALQPLRVVVVRQEAVLEVWAYCCATKTTLLCRGLLAQLRALPRTLPLPQIQGQ